MRPRKCRIIREAAGARLFKPSGFRTRKLDVIILLEEELEAVRLADMEQMDQESAANLMDISRSTFSRVVNNARKVIATALVNGSALKISGGHFNLKGDNNMPNRDGTGPCGNKVIGRGLGNCGKASITKEEAETIAVIKTNEVKNDENDMRRGGRRSLSRKCLRK